MEPVRGLGPYSLRPKRMSTGKRKPEGERKRRKLEGVIVPPASDKFRRLEKELLPGIDNRVTLEHITSRMQWMTLQTLSSVSPAWLQANRDRLTYEARVRTNSRETFVVINNIAQPGDANGIALFSMRDNTYYLLPPIPQVGIPRESLCTTLDGKVYIFGGVNKHSLGSRDVYVLDLAGRKHWQQCAKMQRGRSNLFNNCQFACGVKDGKIYIFGGNTYGGSKYDTRVAEVYDPSKNTWSTIKPMPSSGFSWYPKVATVGEELYVYSEHGKPSGYCLKAYDPVKDDWRIITNFGNTSGEAFFMAHGKLHSMTNARMRVYDIEKNSRTVLYSYNLDEMFRALQVHQVLEVDGEFLATVNYERGDGSFSSLILRMRRGLGMNNTEVVWEKATRSITFQDTKPSMCRIQL